MSKITFITGNENKLREAQGILREYDVVQCDLDIDEIQSMDPHVVVRAKVQAAYDHVGAACFVEDVSMSCPALGGLPGPYVKDFLGALTVEGFAELLLTYDDRSARVQCLIGYADASGVISVFEGMNDGVIVAPRGESSFGFDPVFELTTMGQTYAEMTTEEKNAYSHRSRALRALKEFLR